MNVNKRSKLNKKSKKGFILKCNSSWVYKKNKKKRKGGGGGVLKWEERNEKRRKVYIMKWKKVWRGRSKVCPKMA